MSAKHDLLVYFGLAEPAEDDRVGERHVTGREVLVIVLVAVLVFCVGLVIPGDWSFWETGAVYVGVSVAIGLALRLSAIWSTRGASKR